MGRLSSSSSSGRLGSLDDSSDAPLTNILEDRDPCSPPRASPARDEMFGTHPQNHRRGRDDRRGDWLMDSLGKWVGVNATNPFEDGGDKS